MKKIICLMFLGFLILPASLALAEPEEGRMDKDKMMMSRMHSNKSIVATSDGGIVVLTGHKLIKYDKNLNVVKEVELKSEEKGEHKMMGICPFMKGKNKEMGEEKGETEAEEKAEHEHHN